MPDIELISDFLVSEYLGGAEMVDDNIANLLQTTIHKASAVTIDSNKHYIVCNATHLNNQARNDLIKYGNYSIFEHDFKIHQLREPHYFNNYIFPKNELINLDLFSRAKNVFLQSTDHLNCYSKNTEGIPINYINLSTSIWSEKELDLLEEIGRTVPYSTYKFAISDNPYPLKGRDQSIAWCKNNGLDYSLIKRTDKETFYKNLANHPVLVSMPIRKESFCRLVVEARCLYMNVITPRTYGAVLEPWFTMSGHELITFLKTKTKENIEKIKSLCKN